MSTETFLKQFKREAELHEDHYVMLIQRPNQLKSEIDRLSSTLRGMRFATDALNTLLPRVEDGRDFCNIRDAFFAAFDKHASEAYRQGVRIIWMEAESLATEHLPFDRKD